MRDCSVVIPVHKEKTEVVENLYHKLIAEGFDVVVVDDGGTMMDLEIPALFYTPHEGYGYALKTGIKAAKNNLIITADGDGQHSVEDIVMLYEVFKLIKTQDMIVGTRWNLKETFKRWFGRKILNFIASMICGHYLIDLNSGLRIFKRDSMIGYFPILCDTFSFTTSLTISMVADGKPISYIPITVLPRASGKSHVKLIRHGFITLYYIFRNGFAMRTRGIRKCLRQICGRVTVN